MSALTIKEAIDVALEGFNGSVAEWLKLDPIALRRHVIEWVSDYAEHRGVILDAKLDIEPELDAIIERLRAHRRG